MNTYKIYVFLLLFIAKKMEVVVETLSIVR